MQPKYSLIRRQALRWSATLLLSAGACFKPQSSAQSEVRFTLVAAGDVAHPQNTEHASEFKMLGERMFEPTRFISRSADLAFVSLASAITTRMPTSPNKITFTSAPATLDGLVASGFNIINVGHNHVMDAGKPGLKDTLDLLAAHRQKLPPTKMLIWGGAGLTAEAVR